MLRVTIKKKDFELTPALETYVNQKIVRPVEKLISKYGAGSPILEIEVGRVTRHHKKGKVYHAEANLSLGSNLLRSEVDSEDFREAIDLLEEGIIREIRSFKGKLDARLRRGARVAKKELRFDPAARSYRRGRIRDEGV